jgi:nucleoside-diphosphate-sugar epimerase
VSDGEDISTAELIKRLAVALGKPTHMIPFPMGVVRLAGRILRKTAFVERLVGSLQIDCTKIKIDLNWRPPYTLDQGLKETANWFKKEKSLFKPDD